MVGSGGQAVEGQWWGAGGGMEVVVGQVKEGSLPLATLPLATSLPLDLSSFVSGSL